MPKERSFPTPLKYSEFVKRTSTTLDVLLECRIDDYWSVDGDQELSVQWTGFTQFLTLKWFNSLSDYNLVHKPVPIPQAMKILDAKAAVDKEWEKVEKLPAWQVPNLRSKRQVIEKARKEERIVHFAALMELCHLKNSEMEQKFQTYEGRVVLRGDVVKDDSGSYTGQTKRSN